MVEGRTCERLCKGFTKPLIDPKKKEKQMKQITDYFMEQRNSHTVYALSFFFFELLNLLNVLLQLYVTNICFDEVLTTYRLHLVTLLYEENRSDALKSAFPKSARCTFEFFGPSGSVQRLEGLCLLPINICIEKMVVFILLWFLALVVITGIQVNIKIKK